MKLINKILLTCITPSLFLFSCSTNNENYENKLKGESIKFALINSPQYKYTTKSVSQTYYSVRGSVQVNETGSSYYWSKYSIYIGTGKTDVKFTSSCTNGTGGTFTGTSTKFGTLGYQDGYYYFLIGTPTPGNTTDCTVTISYTTWTNVTKTYSFSIEPEDSIYQDLSYSLSYVDGTSCSSVLTCSIDNSAKTFTLVNKAEFSQEIILKLYLTDLPSIYTNISITYSS